MKEKNPLNIVQGMRLEKNVISLLSNDGRRDYLVRNNGVKIPLLYSIGRKYLIILCIAIPILSDRDDAELCRSMITAYSQLKAAGMDFEMVIVAKITRSTMVVDDYDEEAAVNRFFKAFPCLAVPFSDSESRDSICYSLGLTAANFQSSSLLLDPDQLVLQTNAKCFNSFGAAAFPFTTQHLDALRREDYDMKLREMQSIPITSPWNRVSLEELLGDCHLLRRTGCINNKNKKNNKEFITVSELSKKKCVGLYLCYDGSFIKKLNEIHKKCKANNLEFEVVLVYIAFGSDTTSFINAVNLRLYEERISSWWVMSFVEEVCRRLRRSCHNLIEDALVAITDDGWGDLDAGYVIQHKEDIMGSYRYPFTRICNPAQRRYYGQLPLSFHKKECLRSVLEVF